MASKCQSSTHRALAGVVGSALAARASSAAAAAARGTHHSVAAESHGEVGPTALGAGGEGVAGQGPGKEKRHEKTMKHLVAESLNHIVFECI